MRTPLLRLRENKYGPIIRAEFEHRMVPYTWGMAFARQESAFRPQSFNSMGGDGRRGGAFGMFQLTLLTARTLRFSGQPTELLNPQVNAMWAATLVSDLYARYAGKLTDVAAAYNSGKPFAKAPNVTRAIYVPNIVRYVAEYGSLP